MGQSECSAGRVFVGAVSDNVYSDVVKFPDGEDRKGGPSGKEKRASAVSEPDVYQAGRVDAGDEAGSLRLEARGDEDEGGDNDASGVSADAGSPGTSRVSGPLAEGDGLGLEEGNDRPLKVSCGDCGTVYVFELGRSCPRCEIALAASVAAARGTR